MRSEVGNIRSPRTLLIKKMDLKRKSLEIPWKNSGTQVSVPTCPRKRTVVYVPSVDQ